jgi:hypothetical protein
MTNIEKLKVLGILGSVRLKKGAIDHDDDTYDDSINEMDNSELIEKWCGWHLCDSSWWTVMKEMFDKLEQLDLNKSKA